MNNIGKTEISSETKETEDKEKNVTEVKEESTLAVKTVETEVPSAGKESETAGAGPAAVIHKLYIQYNDLEFSDELMFEAAVNAYCNESGKDKSSVQAVNLYVKPQEGKAYYVINNDAEKSGSIDL